MMTEPYLVAVLPTARTVKAAELQHINQGWKTSSSCSPLKPCEEDFVQLTNCCRMILKICLAIALESITVLRAGLHVNVVHICLAVYKVLVFCPSQLVQSVSLQWANCQ